MQRNECKPGTEVIIRGTISEMTERILTLSKSLSAVMTAKRKMAFLNLLFLSPPRRNTTRHGNTARGIWCESPDFTGGFSGVDTNEALIKARKLMST